MTHANITQNELLQQTDSAEPKYYIRTFDKVDSEFLYWNELSKEWGSHDDATTYVKNDFDQINIYVLTRSEDYSPCWVNEDLIRTETVYEIVCETENCENWVILDEDQPRHHANGCGFTFRCDEEIGVLEDHFLCNECGCRASAEYVLATYED